MQIPGLPWGSKVKYPPAMQEMWLQLLRGKSPLDEGMGTYSSTLAGRIPWIEEPGGLRSTGSQSQAQLYQLSTQASMYLVPFQELLNQEHRGRKQGIGYFKVWNQLYKYLSCVETCVSYSGQITWRKDKEMNSVKQNRGSQETQRENAEISPNQNPTSQGSDPHPQTAGSCRFPPSRPGTRPSEQGPGIPTPLEWTWCPHPQRSTVSEMKAYFTNRHSGRFLFSHEMRRG